MRYTAIVFGACALAAAYHFLADRPISWRPGALVASDPQQMDLPSAEPVAYKDFKIIPRARFSAEVRVLSRSRYWLGTFAKASPLDIAVGWGPMSDSSVLAQIKVTQGGRFYFWHYDDRPPVPREVIETHSANWHLVPANAAAWRALRGIRVGDVVKLEGMLIDIESSDTATIRTSLRRDDTGAGACEVIYVEAASFRYH